MKDITAVQINYRLITVRGWGTRKVHWDYTDIALLGQLFVIIISMKVNERIWIRCMEPPCNNVVLFWMMQSTGYSVLEHSNRIELW